MPTTVDTSQLNGFCKQIAAMPIGVKFWDAMLFEVGRVLEECVRQTTRERLDRIKRSIDFKNRTLPQMSIGRHAPILYFTKSGIGWFLDSPGAGYEGVAKGRRAEGGQTFHPMTEFFRYGNPRWARYQEMLVLLKNKQINVREVIGRAGQSWLQIAMSLGIPITVPAYVRNAPAFKGRSYVNGTSHTRRTEGQLAITMVNTAPILLGTMDGNAILQRSINGRAAYFRKNLELGVFDDVKQIARAYKGLIPSR